MLDGVYCSSMKGIPVFTERFLKNFLEKLIHFAIMANKLYILLAFKLLTKILFLYGKYSKVTALPTVMLQIYFSLFHFYLITIAN